jgi:hypothetical protein
MTEEDRALVVELSDRLIELYTDRDAACDVCATSK